MKNVFTVFTSPTATFERVKEKGKTAWIIPTIVSVVLLLVMVYLQMPLLEKDFLKRFKEQNVDPSMIDSFMSYSKMMSYVGGAITVVASVFIMGLLLLLLNLIVRGEAKYMQLVSLSALAALPGMIGGLLTAILAITMKAQSLNDMALNFGALVADKSSTLYKLLSVIDPFSIWSLILYIIGASVLMNRPRNKVAIWIVIVWALVSFGTVLL